jgi:hypothetical protein
MRRCFLAFLFAFLVVSDLTGQTPNVVVFHEDGFPAADSAVPTRGALSAALPGAQFANSAELNARLGSPETSVLVLPYASAFPEASWSAIKSYLDRGGNLVVIGGRPFTRAAYKTGVGWKLRNYSVRFTRALLINDYQATAGSQGHDFVPNEELAVAVPTFAWKSAYSPIIRLSVVDLYKRQGSTGSIDARLDSLVWGVKDGRKLSTPVVMVDHLSNAFVGGRWVLMNAAFDESVFTAESGKRLLREVVALASRGTEQFRLQVQYPLYLENEPVQIEATTEAAACKPECTLRLTVRSDAVGKVEHEQSVTAQPAQKLMVPPVKAKGFHVIEARWMQGEKVLRVYRSGFWMRDEAFLRSGPKFGTNQHYFELDGKPLAVVGTTYMASDVQRQFLIQPNAYVWDRDLGHIKSAGLNMIRTGWWSAWDKSIDASGQPTEHAMRSIEAYFMSCRRHGLPVQWTFFAFLPDVLGGQNAYLDPEGVARQQTLIRTVVSRFKDVPFVAWDFINEPSISSTLWRNVPNGDSIEVKKWNEWLAKKYPDRAELAERWNASALPEVLPLPAAAEFEARGMYTGKNSLKLYDFGLFSQDVFAAWARLLGKTIRETGSQQLMTVGQDEMGVHARPNNAFFSDAVDFTTMHSWWLNDALLWDSLIAKQPGKAMLVQETGLQRELFMNEQARRTAENEAKLIERKIALSFVNGTGMLQWLWNINAYMSEDNEVPIGAVRVDGTEKPEATVLRGFASFAAKASPYLRDPDQPEVAIVTSQALQYSVHNGIAAAAQQKAVRALHYYNRVPAYLITENQIDNLGKPKLAILPSPQALTERAWQALLGYVRGGGTLLVTGPVNRDEHWRVVDRMGDGKGAVAPLTVREYTMKVGEVSVPVSFTQDAQNWLEVVNFAGFGALREVQLGTGRIIFVPYPVELAEGFEPTVRLYEHALRSARVTQPFTLDSPISNGVLIFPVPLRDAMLYVLASDSAEDHTVRLTDRWSGARLNVPLGAEGGALLLLDKKTGRVIAQL